jgi:hypothetical protein
MMFYSYISILAVLVVRDGIQKLARDDESSQKKEMRIINRATGGHDKIFNSDAVTIVPDLIEPEYA